MTIRERAQATLNFWRYTRHQQRRGRSAKAALGLFPDYRQNQQPTWHLHHLDNFINEGYNLNSVIYSAINYKVRSAGQVPLRAYEGTRDAPEALDAGHPLQRLADRPNPYFSFVELQALNEVYYNLFGNVYVVMLNRRDGIPQSMWTLRPDCVYHIYARGRKIKGYIYIPPGGTQDDAIPFLPQDVMHVKLPNPGDPYAGLGKGLSPLYPLGQSADVDNALTAFLKLRMDHGAMVEHVLKTDLPLDEETVVEVQERWMAHYGNWRQWITPAVLDQNLDYVRVGTPFNELGMEKLDARNESRIVAPFGVPLNLKPVIDAIEIPVCFEAVFQRVGSGIELHRIGDTVVIGVRMERICPFPVLLAIVQTVIVPIRIGSIR